jgi:5-methylcytosine-specific restriction endonuclease McrA
MPLKGPSDYLFNLRAMSSSEAKRLWRSAIKDHWNNQCVYCGSNHDLTLDHVIPKARGGHNITSNVVPACRKCNQSRVRTTGYLGGLVKSILTILIFQKSLLGQLAS